MMIAIGALEKKLVAESPAEAVVQVVALPAKAPVNVVAANAFVFAL